MKGSSLRRKRRKRIVFKIVYDQQPLPETKEEAVARKIKHGYPAKSNLKWRS